MLIGDKNGDLFRNKPYLLLSTYSEQNRAFLIVSPLEVFSFYFLIKVLEPNDSLDFFLIKIVIIVLIL